MYGRRTDGQMDVKTDGWNFTAFYRTLSPVGAAALLPSETSQHQRSRAREPLTSWCLLATGCNFMTSKELGKGFAELKMPLGKVFGQRGPSLVEWREIPSIYLYVYPYFGISPSWLALWQILSRKFWQNNRWKLFFWPKILKKDYIRINYGKKICQSFLKKGNFMLKKNLWQNFFSAKTLVLRCAHKSLYEGLSVHWSVGPLVLHYFLWRESTK